MKTFVMAGGGGTRLWPLSRRSFPKQFLKLFDHESLFQKTISRVLNICLPRDVLILTNEKHSLLVKKDLNEMTNNKAEDFHIVLEPDIRNTAPAIALGVKYCLDVIKTDVEDVIFVTPSDHIIEPNDKFSKVLSEALKYALDGYIVTFGIKPSKPETGYGYIRVSSNVNGSHNIFTVDRFVEKPDYQTAKRYVESNIYFWNSGMFCFQIKTILAELKDFAPEIYDLLAFGYEELVRRFSMMPNISIDYAVMEKSQRIVAALADIYWNDVGSWDSVYEIRDKDRNGNATGGASMSVGSEGNLLLGAGRMIATVGLKDTIVVDSPDALLVLRRGQSQGVKDLVEALRRENRPETEGHLTVYRPWGSFKEIYQAKGFKVKHITVDPGQKLSLQKHRFRSEHWVVIKGVGNFTVGDRVIELRDDQGVYIPRGEVHRMENRGETSLEVIEVQLGDYLGEDDIVRIEDIYGRA